MKKLYSLVANTALLAGVLLLFVVPLAAGQLIGSYQSGTLGESTSALLDAESAQALPYSVETSTEEFSPYVLFETDPMSDQDLYQTAVTFTSFSKQQASYNNLIRVTNTSTDSLSFRVEAGTVSGEMSKSSLWLTTSTGQTTGATLTTAVTKKGRDILEVGQTIGFNSGSLVVGKQVLEGYGLDQQQISLAKPLAEKVAAGQRVYFNPIYFAVKAKPVLSETQWLSLEPGQQASLNLVVASEKSSSETTQLVLPLSLHFSSDN